MYAYAHVRMYVTLLRDLSRRRQDLRGRPSDIQVEWLSTQSLPNSRESIQHGTSFVSICMYGHMHADAHIWEDHCFWFLIFWETLWLVNRKVRHDCETTATKAEQARYLQWHQGKNLLKENQRNRRGKRVAEANEKPLVTREAAGITSSHTRVRIGVHTSTMVTITRLRDASIHVPTRLTTGSRVGWAGQRLRVQARFRLSQI